MSTGESKSQRKARALWSRQAEGMLLWGQLAIGELEAQILAGSPYHAFQE